MIYNTDSPVQQATVQQSTIELLLATLYSVQPGAHLAPIEQWFHKYAASLGFADVVGDDLLCKLRALLTFLENQPWGHSLASAVHASIMAITRIHRFEEAVEIESRRQIYNFVYGLTHEINNPLANIAARAQQLMASAKDPESAKSLGTIVDQSMRAHEMLAESMNAVRPPKMELELVDITRVITETLEKFRNNTNASGVDVFAHPMASNLFSQANYNAMCECLSSLLKNAVEACRPGDRIDVIAEVLEAGDPDGAMWSGTGKQIRIAIRDTGRGLSASDLDQVWDLYYSGRDSGRGLGISLAKARRLIELFEGKIWLCSNPNAGTTVEIRLPSAPPPVANRRKIAI